MNTRRVSAIVLRQFYLLKGSPVRILPMFAWVAIDIILWGFISKYLTTITEKGDTFIPTMLGAVLLWDFFVRVMHGVSTAFLEDVWSRNFLNLFATPLLVSEYLMGLVVTSVLTSLLSLIAMLLLASTFFGLSFLSYGVSLIGFLFVLFLFGIALGIFGSAIVLHYGPASEWLIWPLPAMLSPFAAVFYPLSTLPEWMQMLAKLVPPSYVFEGLRSLVFGGDYIWWNLSCGALLASGYILLASWVFNKLYNNAVSSGLLARYSAESVG